MKTIKQVRQRNPLVHHLTNDVVVNFSANGLLSFGASPIMAKEIKEVTQIAQISDALLLNIGTAHQIDIEAMILAGQAANQKGIPVVLDPVGVAASSFRQESVARLLRSVSMTVIKGNAGEIAHLAGHTWETRGVDSTSGTVEALAGLAQKVAHTYETIVIVTGPTDIITYPFDDQATNDSSKQTLINESGLALLTQVTGSGCLLGSIIAATLGAVCQHRSVNEMNLAQLATASLDTVRFYGQAAERAAAHAPLKGPASFALHFIDELSWEGA